MLPAAPTTLPCKRVLGRTYRPTSLLYAFAAYNADVAAELAACVVMLRIYLSRLRVVPSLTTTAHTGSCSATYHLPYPACQYACSVMNRHTIPLPHISRYLLLVLISGPNRLARLTNTTAPALLPPVTSTLAAHIWTETLLRSLLSGRAWTRPTCVCVNARATKIFSP